MSSPALPFKTRCVHDLAWVIQSPPFISGHIAGVNWWSSDHFTREYRDCLGALLKLDKQPDSLLQALGNVKSHRLGHYFEALVAFWLQISPNYTLLLSNHPLRAATKTLGEIDFLTHEVATGKIVHLEVAVKFYLGIDNLDEMSNWHGPGLRDRLDKKFNHLCTHQTQLATKYPELMPYPIDESACFIKGRLFYPPNTVPSTRFTNNEHLDGHWHQLPDRPDTSSIASPQGYQQLAKRDWLANTNANETQLQLPTQLPDTVEEPALYACYENNEEAERFFILPEHFWQQL